MFAVALHTQHHSPEGVIADRQIHLEARQGLGGHLLHLRSLAAAQEVDRQLVRMLQAIRSRFRLSCQVVEVEVAMGWMEEVELQDTSKLLFRYSLET